MRQEIYTILNSTIKERGSTGWIHHTKPDLNQPKINNSYNEDGIEIEIPDDKAETERMKPQRCYYSSKKLSYEERAKLSLKDDAYRITISYSNQYEITKGDVFEDALGEKYSIENIDRLGDRESRTMLYQFLVVQD